MSFVVVEFLEQGTMRYRLSYRVDLYAPGVQEEIHQV